MQACKKRHKIESTNINTGTKYGHRSPKDADINTDTNGEEGSVTAKSLQTAAAAAVEKKKKRGQQETS